eukprot:CAMPEP_0176311988 /NCGR_PEP_ID=MMETSP0121_2-20121125/66431_1 /TAXON_ID=160619 /ORGANISM="Kryptoperidinium foliaceum, Strain CCMP 1326" /LENGTH=32 /DNA_ID= /DNA_START= /DNA_END= /DNA_ORIENTATION=
MTEYNNLSFSKRPRHTMAEPKDSKDERFAELF